MPATKQKTVKPEAALKFGRSQTLVTAWLSDEKGNQFQVFISGLEDKVNNFIRYQKNKFKNNELGIRVQVNPMPDTTKGAETDSTEMNFAMSEPDEVFNKGGIKIGIQRYKMVTPLPYEITYIIDPPLQAVGQGVSSDSGTFQLDFTNITANVTCVVRKGTISFQLLENGFTVDGPFTLPDPINAQIEKTIVKNQSQLNQDARWQIIVQGIAQANNFELRYAKKYM